MLGLSATAQFCGVSEPVFEYICVQRHRRHIVLNGFHVLFAAEPCHNAQKIREGLNVIRTTRDRRSFDLARCIEANFAALAGIDRRCRNGRHAAQPCASW